MKKLREQPQSTLKKRVHDLKAFRTSVTKKAVGGGSMFLVYFCKGYRAIELIEGPLNGAMCCKILL